MQVSPGRHVMLSEHGMHVDSPLDPPSVLVEPLDDPVLVSLAISVVEVVDVTSVLPLDGPMVVSPSVVVPVVTTDVVSTEPADSSSLLVVVMTTPSTLHAVSVRNVATVTD